MKEITDESRDIAAQIWCKPETSHIQMDVVLAQAFAEALDQKEHQIVALELKIAEAEKRVEELKRQQEVAEKAFLGSIDDSDSHLKEIKDLKAENEEVKVAMKDE